MPGYHLDFNAGTGTDLENFFNPPRFSDSTAMIRGCPK